MSTLENVPFENAVAQIAAACAPGEAETIELGAASGRVLAHTLVAEDDLVPFARSAMDGFAVNAAEAFERRTFPIRGRAYAEHGRSLDHVAGTAIAIATGAPIPLGTDVVVPFEEVTERDGTIVLAGLRAIRAGDHVFPPGEDARRGDVLARAGEALRPPVLALLASAGFATIDVVRRPRVAIITSGDEIVAVSSRPAFGEIRNSNATAVAAALVAFGAEIVSTEHARDDRDALRSAIGRAVERADLVITTGGASVGERDYVKPGTRGPRGIVRLSFGRDATGATFGIRATRRAVRPRAAGQSRRGLRNARRTRPRGDLRPRGSSRRSLATHRRALTRRDS